MIGTRLNDDFSVAAESGAQAHNVDTDPTMDRATHTLAPTSPLRHRTPLVRRDELGLRQRDEEVAR
jgi:hypothetical protein